MLDTARTLMRLPRHLSGALDATAKTVRGVSGLQVVVTERLISLDRGLRDALDALRDVASDLERVRSTVEPQHARVAAIEDGLGILPVLAADLERVRSTVEPQHARVAVIEQGLEVLPALAAEVTRVRETVEPQHRRVEAIQQAIGRLEERMASLQRSLEVLEGSVENATERLPDPDAPGPIARARDTITGRS